MPLLLRFALLYGSNSRTQSEITFGERCSLNGVGLLLFDKTRRGVFPCGDLLFHS